MILSGSQQSFLARELGRDIAYGRTEVQLVGTGRGRGYALITRQGWEKGRWVFREEVKIGGGGKVTRRTAGA